MIEGCSPPRSRLWHPYYIHKKNWYIQFKGSHDLYLSFYDQFVHLEALGKRLKVILYLGIDFGNLGTTLEKFGTSLRKFDKYDF